MGKMKHTCNLDCKQCWSMFIFKSFYICSLQKQSFFSHAILIFRKLHNNANGQNIQFIQESFVVNFEKCRFLIQSITMCVLMILYLISLTNSFYLSGILRRR